MKKMLLMLLFAASTVRAEQGALTVTPAVVMLRGDAGQSTTQRLRLTNGASHPFSFELVAEDVIVRDGQRIFAPAGSLAGSIAATAVFSQKNVTVKPGETVTVDVTITIPQNTPVRGVVALFRGNDRIVRGSTAMTASIGTLMTFALSDARAVDAGDVKIVPQSATANATFVQHVVNSGTEPLVARGMAAILDGHGTLIGKAPLSTRRLLPGEQTDLRGEYQGELARGHYRVLLTCDAEGKTVTRTAEMEVR
jgi:hypothetical protein